MESDADPSLNRNGVAKLPAYFLALSDQLPQPIWISRDGGDWTWASLSWTATTGQTSLASKGDGWKLAIHQDDRQRTELAWAQANLTGILDIEHRLIDVGRPSDLRWFHTRAAPLPALVGRSREWLGSCTEIHGRSVSHDSVQNRMDQLLALIRLVVRRTKQQGISGETYADRVESRLNAIARTQAMLNRPTGHIDMAVLVREALLAQASQEGERICIKGPRVILHRAAVAIFGLAMQELATNAVEHGALSEQGGSISVVWQVNNSLLQFEWSETLRTRLDCSSLRSGFGKEVIEKVLQLELGSVGSLDVLPTGARCSLTIPLGPNLTMPGAAPA